MAPRKKSRKTRWKKWAAVMPTLFLVLQCVQKVEEVGRDMAPTVTRIVAAANVAVNGRPVTRGELEALRVDPKW